MENFSLERSVLADLEVAGQQDSNSSNNRDIILAPEAQEKQDSTSTLLRGKPDAYYNLASVLIRPEDSRWQMEYETMPVNIRIFMETTKNSREDAKFPHCIGSMSSILPPFPQEKYMGMWYERIKSCVEEEAHQEHCSNDMEYAGKDRINDTDYRLSNKAVAIHSQWQELPSKIQDYNQHLRLLQEIETEILILGNRIPLLTGIMAVLRRVRKADKAYANLQVYRLQSVPEYKRHDMLYPNVNNYRLLCLRSLESKVIHYLVQVMKTILDGQGQIQKEVLYESTLWKSEYFKILVWDGMANVALMANITFYTTNYSFIEHCTSNVNRDNPTFRQYF